MLGALVCNGWIKIFDGCQEKKMVFCRKGVKFFLMLLSVLIDAGILIVALVILLVNRMLICLNFGFMSYCTMMSTNDVSMIDVEMY